MNLIALRLLLLFQNQLEQANWFKIYSQKKRALDWIFYFFLIYEVTEKMTVCDYFLIRMEKTEWNGIHVSILVQFWM